MDFIETIYNKILTMGKHRFSLTDISKWTGFEHGFDRRALSKSLDILVKNNKLIKQKSGYYTIVSEKSLKKCVILGTSKDYVFARESAHLNDKNNDIFISSANLSDACHGDTVMVEVGISGKDRKYKRELPLVAEGKREGRVVEIIQRGYETIVGIMSITDRGVAMVMPDERRFCDAIFIAPTDTCGAGNNTKVVVKILDYPSDIKMARGKVIEVLGNPSDAKVTTLSIIRSFNLFEEFPEDVEKEAKKVSIPVEKDNKEGRKDFRDRLIITIDGEDARDFDDAISLVKDGDDYKLGVYIADVSHYVKEGSKLDAEAFKRGTSVYFPDNVLPMLPIELSNGICSLNPNEERFVLAVEATLDKNGKVVDYEINKGIIKSKYRMTYSLVTKILDGDEMARKNYAELVPMLTNMKALAETLIQRRNNAGQLDFDIPEPQIFMNKDGTVRDIIKKPREMSDRIIEQFMVLTNEIVARHFDKIEMPFVYRVHEVPVIEKVQRFKAFASSLGLKFTTDGKDPSPKDFQVLLKESEGKDYSIALSKVMLRSMQKARYDTENLGHFGLALRDYCHFTSPIRRYPDLSIHRIISAHLEGKMTAKKMHEFEEYVERSAERSSTMERQAEEAERAVDAQKETEFMQGKIGEVFPGIISGVTENGIYVELENTIEGFISIARLPDGRYEYDENHYMIRGNGKTYRIGDKIEIRVVSTDIVLRRIDFELSDFHKEVDAFDEGMKASVNRKQFREEAKEERSGKRKNRGNKSQTNDEKYRRHKNKGLNSRKKRKKKKIIT